MKFIFAVALLFLSAVAAQVANPNRALVELLNKRAETLISSTKAHIEELKKQDKGHLLETIERQLKEVETIEKDLKTQLASHLEQALHKLHVDEEELFHLENSISEELDFLTHQHTPQGSDVTALVHKAVELVRHAKQVEASHPQAKELKAIQAEVTQIETLIKAVQAKPAPADLKKDEEQLAKHEKTLTTLIQKVSIRNPTTPASVHF